MKSKQLADCHLDLCWLTMAYKGQPQKSRHACERCKRIPGLNQLLALESAQTKLYEQTCDIKDFGVIGPSAPRALVCERFWG